MDTPKTILDLALELGVRTQTLQNALEKLGLENTDPSTDLDMDMEKPIIEQLAMDGHISSNLMKGKGRRTFDKQSPVDDELLTEALGASESGFNESRLPTNLLPDEDLEQKPSFMQRLFGKKPRLAESLAERSLSPEEIDQHFSTSAPMHHSPTFDSDPEEQQEATIKRDESTQPIPEEIHQEEPEIPMEESPQEETVADIDDLPEEIPEEMVEEIDEPEATTSEEEDAGLEEELETIENIEDEDIDLDEDISLEEEPETAETEEVTEESSGDEIELDDSLLEDMDDIKIPESEDDLGDIDVEDLGDLDELNELTSDETTPEEPVAEDESEELEPIPDEESVDIGDTEESPETEEEEDSEEEPAPEEEPQKEPVLSFFSKLLSRVQLSPTETWAVMGGSLATMLALLGITMFWWYNNSPKAQLSLWNEAEMHYQRASQAEEDNNWRKASYEWDQSADLFQQFLQDFPNHPNTKDAFNYLCNSYYKLASGYEQAGDIKQSENLYRQMAQFYEQYLSYLDRLATEYVGADQEQRHLAYPDVEQQRIALFRIALANRKLNRFDTAIEKLQDFVRLFPESEFAYQALKGIGDTYQDWALVNKEQEPKLLSESINAYNQALNTLPAEEHAARMKMNADLGDIAIKLYERSIANEKLDEANSHLTEAIGYYENAENEGRQVQISAIPTEEDQRFQLQKQRIFKQLADLYLIRGREAANKWNERESAAEPYPDGIVYKQELLDAAEDSKQEAHKFVNNAKKLYQELLRDGHLLDRDESHEIQYNQCESNYVLRDYNQTLAAGERLLSTTLPLNQEIEAKTNYLLGHAAWQLADQTGNYTKVKEYYHRAIELDPLYPKETNGEISHLAEIRLTNAYFLLDNKYEEAIKRYEDAVSRYPETGYTYLTLYWYGKALDEYGDELSNQANQIEQEAREAGNPPALVQKSRDIRNDASDQYKEAVNKFGRAIASRDSSRYVDTQNETYLIDIMFNRGHSAFKGGQYKEAEQLFESALAKYRDNTVAHSYVPKAIERLGDINVLLANYGRAVQHYKDYLKHSYDDSQARVSMKLAEAYQNQYSYNKAREWYRRIVSEYPPPTEKEVQRALRLGIPIEKGPGFRAMKKLADSYHREAASYIDQDRIDKLNQALAAYQEMIKSYPLNAQNPLLPSDPDSQRKIASIYYELGQFQQAADNYKAYLSSVPNDPRRGMVYYRIGKSYVELGKFDEAIQTLKNINEDSMDTPAQYGDALILLGRAFEARANEYLKEGEGDLYERYLERAQQAYNRVNITKHPAKIKEAFALKNNIDSIIESRNELANIQQQP